MISKEEIQVLLHSTETFRVGRTTSSRYGKDIVKIQ